MGRTGFHGAEEAVIYKPVFFNLRGPPVASKDCFVHPDTHRHPAPAAQDKHSAKVAT